MKKNIHPKWYADAQITCVCGNSFTVGATQPKIDVQVCSACHPFYTGQMKYVDTAGRVDAFKAKQKQAAKKVLSKTEKRRLKRERKLKAELEKPESLEAVRKAAKKGKKKK